MPITFQAPEPVAPQAAAAYGAAEIGARNNSTLAGLYESGARNQLQANLGTAQLQTEGAIARSREETSRGNEQAQLAEQGRQFDQGRIDRQAAQEFSYRHEAAQSQHRAELAAWLNGQELSQKEEQRLRTMKNSVADVSADGNLSPEEKAAAIGKLRTGIDIYQMRQQKALAQQEQSHAAQYEAQAKRQTEVALKNADLNSKTLEQRTVTAPTPEGQARARKELGPGASNEDVRQRAIDNGDYTQHIQVGFDQYGHPSWKEVQNPRRAARQKAAEDLDAIRLKDYSAAVAKAERDTDAWAKQRDAKQAALAEKAGTVPEPLTPDQIHQNFLDTLRRRGLEPTWEEQRARKAGGPGRGDDVGGGDVPGEKPPEKPFDPAKSATWSPRQKQAMGDFDVLQKRASDLPADDKVAVSRAIDSAKEVIAAYGSVEQITDPDDKQQLARALSTLARLLPSGQESTREGRLRTPGRGLAQPMTNPPSGVYGFAPMVVPTGR